MLEHGCEEQDNLMQVQILWSAQTIYIIITENYKKIFCLLHKLSFSLCWAQWKPFHNSISISLLLCSWYPLCFALNTDTGLMISGKYQLLLKNIIHITLNQLISISYLMLRVHCCWTLNPASDVCGAEEVSFLRYPRWWFWEALIKMDKT